MGRDLMVNKKEFCLVAGNGEFFNNSVKYLCLACDTTGEVAELNREMVMYDAEQVYFNGEKVAIDTDEAFACPHCGNKNVITNTLKAKIGMYADKIDVMEDQHFFRIDVENKVYCPQIREDVLPESYNTGSLSEMVRVLSSMPNYSSNVYFEQKGVEFYQGVCFSIELDKLTKELSVYTRNGQKVNIIDRKKPNRDMMLLELSLPMFGRSLGELSDGYHLLPNEIKQMLASKLYEQLTPYVRQKFKYSDILTVEEISRLALLNRFPLFEGLSVDFHVNAIELDKELLKDVSTLHELIMKLVPKASKRVRNRIIQRIMPSDEVVEKSFSRSSIVFSMLNTPEAMNNLLDFMEKEGVYIRLNGQTRIHIEELNEHKAIPHTETAELIYEILVEGSFDKYINSIVSGKAFINEGQEGQKRAVRGVKSLQTSTLVNLNFMLEDLSRQLYRLKRYENLFLHDLSNEGDVSLEGLDLELCKNQLTKVQTILHASQQYHSIKKLHDDVSALDGEILLKNWIYEYDERALCLEMKISEFEFKIPKESFDIVQLGKDMDICVGSYNMDVVDGDCYIVGVYKNEKPVLCIEIDSFYTIKQVKMKNNKLLDSSKLYDADIIEVLKAFIDEQGLSIETEDLVFTDLDNSFDEEEYWEDEAV